MLLISYSLRRSDIPESGSVVLAATRGYPLTTWCPANTSNLFLMLFNDEFQFDLIILAWAKRALRPFVNVGVILVYGPNKYLSILADSG